jgi:hypothetical protein
MVWTLVQWLKPLFKWLWKSRRNPVLVGWVTQLVAAHAVSEKRGARRAHSGNEATA